MADNKCIGCNLKVTSPQNICLCATIQFLPVELFIPKKTIGTTLTLTCRIAAKKENIIFLIAKNIYLQLYCKAKNIGYYLIWLI